MLTHKQMYKDFCTWSPEYASMVMKYKPWGSSSIVIWLKNGQKYKVKMYARDKFVMQMVTDADIEKKGIKLNEDN